MSDETEMADEAAVDTGEPIAALADLAEEPAAGFVGRLWRRIDRRRLGGELADMSIQGLLAALAEYLGWIFGSLGSGESREGTIDDRGETS